MTPDDFLTRLPHRAVIAITGPDARDFLQRVVTNGPQGTAPGKALGSALLTPQGKVLADLIFLDDGAGGLFADVPLSEAESLLKRFTLYRLRAKAELALRGDLAVVAASGESALPGEVLAAAPDPRAEGAGWRAIVATADGLPAALDSYDRARWRAFITEMPVDYPPSELFSTDVNHDLLHMIDYKKGCFVGQEVASRMHRKGGVRKRTVRVSGERVFEPGLPVMAGETPLGEVLSGGQGAGLALVRVDRLEQALASGAAPRVAGVPAVFSLPG